MKNFLLKLKSSMKTTRFILLMACVGGVSLLNINSVRSDTVRLTSKQSVIGDVKQMTPDSVTLIRGNSETPVTTDKITAISFTDEPSKLSQAREAVVTGRFEDAITALAELDTSGLSGYLAADAAFYRAAAAAELALRGRSPVNEAGSKLADFVKTYPENYHYYQANRLIGDLLVAAGQPGSAVAYYETIGKAPWPEYQADSKIGMASALLADGKTAEAQALLGQVATPDALTPLQKAQIELLKAQSLINENQPDEAVGLIEAMLKTTSPEEIDLNAQAYNLLGRAHRQANRLQDALLAYLHVDLLYPGNAGAHAEALSNLAQLWTAEHKPERAQLALETLKQRYQYSRWNK